MWCELHERAFRRFGGVPQLVVLDNLKEGVLKPDVYDPTINPLYRDVLAHYGVLPLPARVRHPDRKGKVESTIGYAQKTPLRGRRFETLDEAQRYLDAWSDRWADTRIHGTTKQQVAAMFETEKPFLRALPAESFRYYEHGVRAVHLDGCIEVARAYYTVPPAWIGQQLVRIIDPKSGEMIREHLRQLPGKFRVDSRDQSPKTPLSIAQLLHRANNAGKHVGALCYAIEQRRSQYGAREILGVLALIKKHGSRQVDECCETALDVGAPYYRTVRKLVESRPQPPPLKQVDELIRDLTHYRHVIDSRS